VDVFMEMVRHLRKQYLVETKAAVETPRYDDAGNLVQHTWVVKDPVEFCLQAHPRRLHETLGG
jgi:hypothetical protein